MNEIATLAPALAGGILLGTIFFGVLWWTVQKGVSSKHPALLFSLSALLRTSITLAGFYLIARDHWERLLACLLGFLIARFVVSRLAAPAVDHRCSQAREAGHAT